MHPLKVKRKVRYTKAFRICTKLQKYEGKDQATIDKEMEDFHPTETLKELSETLNNVRNEIDEVLDPILVVQAENDEMINPQSANYIYENVDSDEKTSNGMQIQDMSLQSIKKRTSIRRCIQFLRIFRLV